MKIAKVTTLKLNSIAEDFSRPVLLKWGSAKPFEI